MPEGRKGWIWSEETQGFHPPVPYPIDGKTYDWDEDKLEWIEGIPED